MNVKYILNSVKEDGQFRNVFIETDWFRHEDGGCQDGPQETQGDVFNIKEKPEWVLFCV